MRFVGLDVGLAGGFRRDEFVSKWLAGFCIWSDFPMFTHVSPAIKGNSPSVVDLMHLVGHISVEEACAHTH